jgi:hypothetical protein
LLGFARFPGQKKKAALVDRDLRQLIRKRKTSVKNAYLASWN